MSCLTLVYPGEYSSPLQAMQRVYARWLSAWSAEKDTKSRSHPILRVCAIIIGIFRQRAPGASVSLAIPSRILRFLAISTSDDDLVPKFLTPLFERHQSPERSAG